MKKFIGFELEINDNLIPNETDNLIYSNEYGEIYSNDNLDWLLNNQEKYENKIKMIYIDPPYNTGTDRLYKDTFGYSTNWLNFMYPRLRLARDLLKDDGVIFISIDDNEQAHLKLMMDEIFGIENFVACLVWNTKNSARGVPPVNMLMSNHEYILCYSKQSKIIFNGIERTIEDFSNHDNDHRGLWRSESIRATGVQYNYFAIINPVTQKEYFGNWAFSKNKIIEMINDNRIIFPIKSDGTPRQKKFFNSYRNDKKAIVTNLGWYSTENSTKDLMSIFDNKKVFNFSKPLDLIKFLIQQSTNNNDIVLDFFAGSGTTAHAVMELNKEDGLSRKFILVQLDEDLTKYKKYKKSDKLNNIKRGDFILDDDGNKIEEDFDLQSESYKFCVNNDLPNNISSLTKERVIRAYNKLFNK